MNNYEKYGFKLVNGKLEPLPRGSKLTKLPTGHIDLGSHVRVTAYPYNDGRAGKVIEISNTLCLVQYDPEVFPLVTGVWGFDDLEVIE